MMTSASTTRAMAGLPRRTLYTAPRVPQAKPSLMPRSQRASTVRVQAIGGLGPIVPLVARTLIAGTLFYCSMNWVFYRGVRKDTEKIIESEGGKQAERAKRVDKLTNSDGKKNQ